MAQTITSSANYDTHLSNVNFSLLLEPTASARSPQPGVLTSNWCDGMEMYAQKRSKFRQLFVQSIKEDGPELHLGKLALYLAGEEYPGLDTDNYVQQLDQLAFQAQEAVGDPTDQRSLIEALSRVLFRREGFSGDTAANSGPDSYFLNRVLDTRAGVAITLSILYLELARRIGIKCSGVGLPGHFVVHLDALDLHFDPFHSGQLLSTMDCRNLVHNLVGLHLPWREEYVVPYNDLDIMFRLLNNLKNLYMKDGDYTRAADSLQRMLLINPSVHYLHRDLAWCYCNTGDHTAAWQHLELYLQECWPCPNEDEMRYQVESLWSAISRSG